MTPEAQSLTAAEYAEMETLSLSRQFVIMARHKAELDASLKQLKARMATLQAVILSRFERDRVQNMNVDGVTLYVHSQLWAGAKDHRDATIQALKQCGYQDLVHEAFNAQTLSAIMREKREEFEAAEKRPLSAEEVLDRLPSELADTVRLSEVTELRARLGE